MIATFIFLFHIVAQCLLWCIVYTTTKNNPIMILHDFICDAEKFATTYGDDHID